MKQHILGKEGKNVKPYDDSGNNIWKILQTVTVTKNLRTMTDWAIWFPIATHIYIWFLWLKVYLLYPNTIHLLKLTFTFHFQIQFILLKLISSNLILSNYKRDSSLIIVQVRIYLKSCLKISAIIPVIDLIILNSLPSLAGKMDWERHWIGSY